MFATHVIGLATRPKFVISVNSLLSWDYLKVALHQLEVGLPYHPEIMEDLIISQ